MSTMQDELSVDGALGMRTENTITALKERLGVERLSLVVLNGLDDYRELLVEAPPDKGWSWRRRIMTAALVLVAFGVFSGFVHPGVRLDRLAKHLSVQVH